MVPSLIHEDMLLISHSIRGKLFGGSTALNFIGWDRASKVEYDSWATFSSRTAPVKWDFEGLLPYFKKTESLNSKFFNFFPGVSSSQYLQALASYAVQDGFNGPVSVCTLYKDQRDTVCAHHPSCRSSIIPFMGTLFSHSSKHGTTLEWEQILTL